MARDFPEWSCPSDEFPAAASSVRTADPANLRSRRFATRSCDRWTCRRRSYSCEFDETRTRCPLRPVTNRNASNNSNYCIIFNRIYFDNIVNNHILINSPFFLDCNTEIKIRIYINYILNYDWLTQLFVINIYIQFYIKKISVKS